MQKAAAEALGNKGAVVASTPKLAQSGDVLLADLRPEPAGLLDAGAVTDAFSPCPRGPEQPLLNRAVSWRYAPGSTRSRSRAIALIENGIADLG